jgi:hypothetical protein
MNHTSKKVKKVTHEGDEGITYSFSVCKHCEKGCCQDTKPPLSETRKKIIKEYLEKHKINIQKPFVKVGYSYPAVNASLFCSFFDKETGKCSVHSVKPETCVAGPVTFDLNFSTKKVEWFLKKGEICAFAAMLYSNKVAFKKHFEIAKKQLTRLICELEPEELRTIVKIDEPQTFKIGEDDLPLEAIKKLGLK